MRQSAHVVRASRSPSVRRGFEPRSRRVRCRPSRKQPTAPSTRGVASEIAYPTSSSLGAGAAPLASPCLRATSYWSLFRGIAIPRQSTRCDLGALDATNMNHSAHQDTPPVRLGTNDALKDVLTLKRGDSSRGRDARCRCATAVESGAIDAVCAPAATHRGRPAFGRCASTAHRAWLDIAVACSRSRAPSS